MNELSNFSRPRGDLSQQSWDIEGFGPEFQSWLKRLSIKQHPLEYIVLAITLAITIAFTILIEGFATIGNFAIVAQNSTALAILSCGMAVVIITRGLDLSQISVMVAVSSVFGLMLSNGFDYSLALLAAFFLAVLLGLLNGWLIAFIEIPALLSTLATAMLIAGACRWAILQGEFLVLIPKSLPVITYISNGKMLGIPVSVVIGILVLIATSILLNKTVIGRIFYAMGDNYIAARLTGLSVRTATVWVYVFSAITAVIAGVIVSSASGTVDFRIVTNGTLLFEVIMVVVLGGIRLRGGRGGVINLLIGVLLISVLRNGMTLMNLSSQVQDLVKGLVLISAIVIDNYINPRDTETDTQGDL